VAPHYVSYGRHIDSFTTDLHYLVMERAERARREAEAVKGTPVEPVHKNVQARFLGMAERLKIARG
jgi:hypothetical protein